MILLPKHACASVAVRKLAMHNSIDYPFAKRATFGIHDKGNLTIINIVFIHRWRPQSYHESYEMRE
jgi:hypothetical protein